MTTRRLMAVLAALPFLVLTVVLVRREAFTRPLMPDLPAVEQVARIEMARGREQVVLERDRLGAWVVVSAADAPGDARKVATLVGELAAIRLAGDTAAPPRREPLEIRLSDFAGREVGRAAFAPGLVITRPDGEAYPLARTPALALWPSAWSTLRAPVLTPAQVRSVTLVGPEGARPLGTLDGKAWADALSRVRAEGFVAGRTINWAGARYLQLRLADGTVVEAQVVPDRREGGWVRFNAEKPGAWRDSRRFAFRLDRIPS